MKGNAVFKGAHNRCLALLAALEPGERLPSRTELSARLGVSRTTVRAVLAALGAAGILTEDGGALLLLRRPRAEDGFPETQTLTVAQSVERRFTEWLLQGDFRAGQTLNSAELARRFGTSTTTIREYLAHFQRFGLIERRPNSAWMFLGVTPGFADDLYEVREMFELRAAAQLIARPARDPAFAALAALEAEHRDLLSRVEARARAFPALDERLHRLVHEASGNRYMIEFYNGVSALFHYTYAWNRGDEAERNRLALGEHLHYIAALRARDLGEAQAALKAHLATARAKLKRSIGDGASGATG
ncbi:GntR family transcriptional regulator [Aurantimonas sp. Leaf443]|uniref:GntR family transcriptional regulator n=1 Tax=Aurantimonas sp. Leaf443 TaxID=1736378 RepID=UPI0006FA06A7|nr:GntR family transcriptional regulator [Aurantimonas sp. Leaf443]KQT84062.1 GntR family transcriptional regulator [Aurantimonas sp. Leaf443]